LDEDAAVAAGRYSVVNFSATRASLASGEGADWSVAKDFAFHNTPEGFDLVCNVKLRRAAPQAASMIAAIETTLNFLAPAAPDRYFEAAGERHPLRWSASVPASELRVVDEWQKVSVTLSAPNARDYWVAPIETVSESEEGFERIYQGSQILAIWPLEMKPGAEWNGQLTLRIASIR
jgi:hypothetical protein